MSNPVDEYRRHLIKSAAGLSLALASNSAHASNVKTSINDSSGPFNLDEVYSRWGTDSAKWDLQLRRFPGRKITAAMGIADMDFRTAPAITHALANRIEHDNWGYMLLPESYYESILNWNLVRYGLEIQRDQLLGATGVLPGLLSAIRAFCPPQSKVLLHAPAYTQLYVTIKAAGCIPLESPLKKESDGYRIDFEDLERQLNSDTKAFLLCNPHNPTGNCWSREDLETLVSLCARNGTVVLSDEIHCDFIAQGQTFTPIFSLESEVAERNAISFNSATKSFNLSAFKTGYIYARNKKLLDKIVASGHSQVVNTLGVVASRAAYEEGTDWLDAVVQYIDQNMHYLETYLAENAPLINFKRPEGTYLAWLDFSGWMEKIGATQLAAAKNKDKDSDAPKIHAGDIMERVLVEEAGVQLDRGYRFGAGGANFMRMNVGTSRLLLETALDNISAAIRAS